MASLWHSVFLGVAHIRMFCLVLVLVVFAAIVVVANFVEVLRLGRESLAKGYRGTAHGETTGTP